MSEAVNRAKHDACLSRLVPSACYNLFSSAGENVMHLESAKSNNPCDRYDTIFIKFSLLRKPIYALPDLMRNHGHGYALELMKGQG